jgi:hypothetical protein
MTRRRKTTAPVAKINQFAVTSELLSMARANAT